jgi:hypothetical protein
MKFAKPVALNRNTHRQLRFRPEGGFGFAADLNAAPLGASEFFAAAKEYAIVFVRGADEEALPVVVLGLKKDENLFVSADGHWTARYLPLSVRSYPFGSVEVRDSANLQIVIDEAYPGFNDTEGTALFGEGGEPATELQGTLRLLTAQRQDITQTRRLGAELRSLGLLTERAAELKAAGGEQFKLDGFCIVDEAKLNALADADLLRLARQGDLALITAHLMSISNIGLLTPKLKPAATAGAAAAGAEHAANPPAAPTKKTRAGAHAKN